MGPVRSTIRALTLFPYLVQGAQEGSGLSPHANTRIMDGGAEAAETVVRQSDSFLLGLFTFFNRSVLRQIAARVRIDLYEGPD